MTNSYEQQVEKVARASAMTDAELRALWREHGGSFHGPRVETATMPEAQWLAFMREIMTHTAPAPAISGGEIDEEQRFKEIYKAAYALWQKDQPGIVWTQDAKERYLVLAAIAAADRSAAAPAPELTVEDDPAFKESFQCCGAYRDDGRCCLEGDPTNERSVYATFHRRAREERLAMPADPAPAISDELRNWLGWAERRLPASLACYIPRELLPDHVTDVMPAPAISGGEMVLAALKANACSCHVNCEPGDGFGCCHWQANEAIRALGAADRSAAAPAPDMVSVPRDVVDELCSWDHCWPGNIDLAFTIGRLRASRQRALAAPAPQQGG